jgi:hypothetical protein
MLSAPCISIASLHFINQFNMQRNMMQPVRETRSSEGWTMRSSLTSLIRGLWHARTANRALVRRTVPCFQVQRKVTHISDTANLISDKDTQ